jgi:hypothetical protein
MDDNRSLLPVYYRVSVTYVLGLFGLCVYG